MTVKSSARVGYLNAILAQGGGNLNNSIFKSSNARGLPGGGMLMFRIDRRISGRLKGWLNIKHYHIFIIIFVFSCICDRYLKIYITLMNGLITDLQN